MLAKDIQHIPFANSKRPGMSFDLLKLEELLSREVDHDLTRLHRIEFFHILLITDGRGYHTIDFTDYGYERGTLFTIRKDQLHRFFRSPNAKGYMLLFTEDFLATHYGQTEVHREVQLFNELLASPKMQLSKEQYQEIINLISIINIEYEQHHDGYAVGIMRSTLHMLILKLARYKGTERSDAEDRKYLGQFLQLQKLVEEHCLSTKKVQDYATMMNCTSKTLNNVCRSILDKSAKTFVDDVLITQIKRLLVNTPLSITEIAYESGFDEATNFYKYFKKHSGVSPESFRLGHQ